MGSHLTDALVELGAERPRLRARHLERRAEQHRAPAHAAEGALRRPDRQDLGRLPRARAARHGHRPAVRLPPRRAGARRRVVAPPVRDGDGEHGRHAQPAPVDRRPRRSSWRSSTRPARRRSTATCASPSPTSTTSTTDGGLILHERSPINPKSIYATAKVAADFLTMNYHDAYGVPGVVTRMFNNYGPRQNPRYVTGTIITQALTRPDDRARPARAAARLLLLHRRRPRPPHRRRARRPRRRLRLRAGREHLDARLGRPDPPRRRGARLLARRPRGRDDACALPARARAR